MNSQIEFQYAPEDLEEASQAMSAENLRQRTLKVKKQSPIARVLIPIAVPVIALLVLSNMTWGKQDAYGMPRPANFVVINLVLPGVIFSGFVLAMALHRRRIGVRGYTRTPLIFFIFSLLPLVMLAGAIMLSRALTSPKAKAMTSIREAPYDWFAILLPQVTWVGFLGVIVFLNAKQVRNRAREAWESQPGLRRPRIVEMNESEIVINEVIAQRRFQWAAFIRLIETKHLFLLCPTESSFEMIPKRAFGEKDAIEAARAFFTGRIVDREKAGHAFAVLPAQAPLPVQTL